MSAAACRRLLGQPDTLRLLGWLRPEAAIHPRTGVDGNRGGGVDGALVRSEAERRGRQRRRHAAPRPLRPARRAAACYSELLAAGATARPSGAAPLRSARLYLSPRAAPLSARGASYLCVRGARRAGPFSAPPLRPLSAAAAAPAPPRLRASAGSQMARLTAAAAPAPAQRADEATAAPRRGPERSGADNKRQPQPWRGEARRGLLIASPGGARADRRRVAYSPLCSLRAPPACRPRAAYLRCARSEPKPT
ncbi:nematocyst expressed protein 3-like [Schistocerca americana]|uniref:nematocyst expressed protein 3-like n=1 Tax=Schistocerca americana TaxID=7009 RepID=UPI001F4F92BE|nr:nematocyst expressed protein 3-like [Schistocerca americana]